MMNITPSNSKFILLNMAIGKELTQTKSSLWKESNVPRKGER
jgi:hypothetical protein